MAAIASLALSTLLATPAAAQHEGHAPPSSPDTTRARPARQPPRRPPASRAGPGHAVHRAQPAHARFPALFGAHPGSREASGTSWQPDASPHRALHGMRGPWHTMLHGAAQLAIDRQGGPRGETDVFANPTAMGAATRPLGGARIGLRTMLTLDPATIGREGYPLLLQTGETADGEEHLVDRQHPHDLFMELAATASVTRGRGSAFLYAGWPGEPALGPPVYMHRFSGEPLPQAPIAHHWLDSSHITFGVLTAGFTWGPYKVEASAFRGREPDQHRWDLEEPRLDSHSFRASWNPAPAWALQASHARLESPEQLAPETDVDRTTASALFHRAGDRSHWQVTAAWGRNRKRPGATQDAWLLESALEAGERHRIFGRWERVEKDELFPEADPRAARVFLVDAVALGYSFLLGSAGPLRWWAGAAGTLSRVPSSLESEYGGDPVSGMGFVEVRVH